MKCEASKARIFFVGLAQSTHTHSWVELLSDQDFDIRLFGVQGTVAPQEFPFPVDSTGSCRMTNLGQTICLRVIRRLLTMWDRHVASNPVFLADALGFLSRMAGNQRYWFEYPDAEWCAEIIHRWKPDVIHSLGLEPASFFMRDVRSKFKLDRPAWIVTARGGPELALGRHVPEMREKISAVLKECDGFIADNRLNLEYALELGLTSEQIVLGGSVPGTGGVDADSLRSLRQAMPSRQRVILWPKAYECPASKALPVLEAIRLAWPKIAPCSIHLTATDPETRQWLRTLPKEIYSSCIVHDRIPRQQLLELMASSRILLAPSLIDGIPNTLYEAMAIGAFPVFSPLETFKDIVIHGEHVLFARNLYPGEIADALVRAMTDDVLVDQASEKNLDLVRTLAGRSAIRQRMSEYYRALAANTGKRKR